MRNAGLEEAQAGIKAAGRNINNLRYTDDTTLPSSFKEARLKEEGIPFPEAMEQFRQCRFADALWQHQAYG